jgi:acyl-CoA thioesterase-1
MFPFHLVHKWLSHQGTSRFSKNGVILAILLLLLGGPNASALAAETFKLMVFGDSLSAGYGLPKPDSFTEKLAKALKQKGLNVEIVASSVSGDTTAGGRARLAWALADKPDAILLELGANDGLRGIEPATSRANLENILKRLKQSGTRVLMTGMKAPPNLGQEYGREFDRIYPDLAAQFKVPLYPFFLEGVVARPDFNQDDGIHPNPLGVDEIVKRILPMVVKLVR